MSQATDRLHLLFNTHDVFIHALAALVTGRRIIKVSCVLAVIDTMLTDIFEGFAENMPEPPKR